MMEQLLAVFSAFYSRNLSTETKRGKRHRAVSGEFNGSTPPLGYDLVTIAHATPSRPPGLYLNPRAAALVRRAFRLYATGRYSDSEIAEWLNTFKYMRNLRADRKPVNRDMIRELLQNPVCTGRVIHVDTLYKDSLGESKFPRRGRGEWFDGKQVGFISDELFELVQQVRASSAPLREKAAEPKTYILRDLVFCDKCMSRKPDGLVHENYGRMRAFWSNVRNIGAYRCLAHDHGYEKCGQKSIDVPIIDDQVMTILMKLDIAAGLRIRIEREIQSRIDNAAAVERMRQIQEVVAHADVSWEDGFTSAEIFLQKREQIQQEIEALPRHDKRQIVQAADLLDNFSFYWHQCASFQTSDQARQELVSTLVDRVYINGRKVVKLILHGRVGITR